MRFDPFRGGRGLASDGWKKANERQPKQERYTLINSNLRNEKTNSFLLGYVYHSGSAGAGGGSGTGARAGAGGGYRAGARAGAGVGFPLLEVSHILEGGVQREPI